MLGTHSYHHWEPISESVIAAKHVYSNTEYQIKYDLITGGGAQQLQMEIMFLYKKQTCLLAIVMEKYGLGLPI